MTPANPPAPDLQKQAGQDLKKPCLNSQPLSLLSPGGAKILR